MKRPLRDIESEEEESDTETVTKQPKHDNAQPRRRGRYKKFLSVCKSMRIPYPHVHPRESEHLDECESCREIWPLYYTEHIKMGLELKKISEMWLELPERERTQRGNMLMNRWQEEKSKGTNLKYRDVMQLCSTEWDHHMTEDEKKTYRTQFEQHKQTYLSAKKKMKSNLIPTTDAGTDDESGFAMDTNLSGEEIQ